MHDRQLARTLGGVLCATTTGRTIGSSVSIINV